MSYFHAGGIDRPLVITKGATSIIPHQNWRGQFARGTYPSGAKSDCDPGQTTGCTPIQWPGEHTTARHESESGGTIQNWFGGLVDGMRDASGQLYMRNRYYDPKTGQFTQTDPIGLAGGLNAYGFANGDPVSYSDPYGLSPCLIYPKACDIAAGAAIGAVMGAATQALSNAANDRPLTEGMGRAALEGGAVGGALGGVGTLVRAVRGANVVDDATRAANAAQSATPRRGAAAALRARGQTFTGTSGARTVNPRVQQMLDDVPATQRSGFHGRCAEINCLSQAADAGVDVSGGTISVVRIRAPGNPGHGTTMPPCPTCAHVLQQAGVRVVP